MLVLPLILWWARSPMCIANGRPRLTISVVAMVAIVVTSADLRNTSFAEDRYHRDYSRAAIERPAEENRLSHEKGRDFGHLREGTLIPPTVGRIVMLGRRWAFVAAAGDAPVIDDGITLDQPAFRESTASFQSKPRPTRLGAATPPAPGSFAATLVGNHGATEIENDGQTPHVVLAENLMLQRIVEAIRADASDDRWTVSGEVTEFFHENRLLIRTAQRANSD